MVDFDFIIKKSPGYWEGQAHRQAHRHTNTQINTMTWPGLGAGPNENTTRTLHLIVLPILGF